jgi:hypothetical protein
LFSPYGGVPSHEIPRQKIPLFLVSLIKLLVKFVVLQSHSQSICVLNQCHIKINTHSVSQPYWNFLPSSLNFYPREICLIVAFVFIQLTCNNTIRSVCLQ